MDAAPGCRLQRRSSANIFSSARRGVAVSDLPTSSVSAVQLVPEKAGSARTHPVPPGGTVRPRTTIESTNYTISKTAASRDTSMCETGKLRLDLMEPEASFFCQAKI
jgi:hypothetical protein